MGGSGGGGDTNIDPLGMGFSGQITNQAAYMRGDKTAPYADNDPNSFKMWYRADDPNNPNRSDVPADDRDMKPADTTTPFTPAPADTVTTTGPPTGGTTATTGDVAADLLEVPSYWSDFTSPLKPIQRRSLKTTGS